MIDLREIARGTDYEFDMYNLSTGSKYGINNEWHDKKGNNYILTKNYLIITANEYFQNDGYSIVNYINDIPENLNVLLNIKSENNILNGFNMLFDLLTSNNINKKVFVNITNIKLNEKSDFHIDNLNKNVKITSMLDDELKENYLVSNESFESWMLNCEEERFKLLLQSLTIDTCSRIKRMREIASNFYRRTPLQLKKANNLEKAVYAYKWFSANISYDYQAHNSDGIVKQDRSDSKDPICTAGNRKGTYEGRARLFKLVLNNYYMNVPCFLVKGTSSNLEHTWNEVLMEDNTTVEFDLSNKQDKVSIVHDELDSYLNNKQDKVKTL